MTWDFLVSYRGRGALGFPGFIEVGVGPGISWFHTEVGVPWDFLVSYRGRGALGFPGFIQR